MKTPIEMYVGAREKALALPAQSVIALKLMVGEFIDLWVAHPKKVTLLVVLELWIHSLMFQHITELQSLMQLIPFFGQ